MRCFKAPSCVWRTADDSRNVQSVHVPDGRKYCVDTSRSVCGVRSVTLLMPIEHTRAKWRQILQTFSGNSLRMLGPNVFDA